jgi:hypothetical protein
MIAAKVTLRSLAVFCALSFLGGALIVALVVRLI